MTTIIDALRDTLQNKNGPARVQEPARHANDSVSV
jgi:hypothetical protein